jgi:hypothetical protein
MIAGQTTKRDGGVQWTAWIPKGDCVHCYVNDRRSRALHTRALPERRGPYLLARAMSSLSDVLSDSSPE